MKYGIITLLLAVLLSACQSTDLTTFELSRASISDLEIDESFNANRRFHTISVSFDYTITPFYDEPDIYHCTLQFLNKDNTSVSQTSGKTIPCKIDSAAGRVSFEVISPYDKRYHATLDGFNKLRKPLQFNLLILQATADNTFTSIANSKIFTSAYTAEKQYVNAFN